MTEVPYENMGFIPGEKEVAIYLQGAIIRDMIKKGKSEADAVLEWSKHSEEFRRLISGDPHVTELFNRGEEEAAEYVKKALNIGAETVN